MRFVILGVSCALLVCGATLGVSLLSETKSTYDAPVDSDSVLAAAAMDAAFQGAVRTKSVTVVVVGPPGGVLADNYVGFLLALNASVWGFRDLGRVSVRSFDSYVTYAERGMPSVAAAYVDGSNSTSFAVVTVGATSGVGARLVAFLAPAIAAARAEFGVADAVMTGDAVFDRDINDALLDDLAAMDSISFPLAVVVRTAARGVVAAGVASVVASVVAAGVASVVAAAVAAGVASVVALVVAAVVASVVAAVAAAVVAGLTCVTSIFCICICICIFAAVVAAVVAGGGGGLTLETRLSQVLMLVLESVRFSIVPLAVILVTLSGSFSVMLPVATSAMDVVNFAPSVMMSATIAMSVDYAVRACCLTCGWARFDVNLLGLVCWLDLIELTWLRWWSWADLTCGGRADSAVVCGRETRAGGGAAAARSCSCSPASGRRPWRRRRWRPTMRGAATVSS